jgi:ketosteroid isomerase-like protein
MKNLQTAQTIYEAFGRGDISAILEQLADNVDWEYGYRNAPNPVPWLQPKTGKASVVEFFSSLGELEIQKFAPTAILERQNLVVALIDLEGTVKSTGKRIVENGEVHIWHFNNDGKVARFRHCADTYQQTMACQL